MGRERKVKTYSRHHGSRVVTVDKGLWDSSEEQKKHVFSLSSESSINFSDSHDCSSKSRASKRIRDKKENLPRRLTRNIRYGSEMESSGSTGNDSLFQTARQKRRVLRDRSNTFNEKVPIGKRKRQPNVPNIVKPIVNKTNNSYNFSEFDDYSLCVSGSPPKGGNKDKSSAEQSRIVAVGNRNSNIIETSTPLAKRTRAYVQASFPKDDTGSCADISLIDSVENSPCLSSEMEMDKLGISSIADSPVIVPSSQKSKSKQEKSLCDSELTPDQDSRIQLQKLRNSLLMMHISGRRGKKLSINSHFNQSASLFSDMTESNVGESDEEDSTQSETENDSEDENLSDIDENEEVDEDEEEEEGEREDEEKEEQSGSTDTSSDSNKNGNSTRYMLNEAVEVSSYETAESESSYHTAQNESQQHLQDQEKFYSPVKTRGRCKSPYLTPSLQNKSLGNLKSLNESLIVMLTPIKRKEQPKEEMSPRAKVFQICQQDEPMSFYSCITPPMMKICTKVGEGVYGEVFRTQNSSQSVALKVIPIEGDFEVNDEPQKTFEGMLPEIVISKELSLLRTNSEARTDNFCEVNSVACVKGKYPRELLKQWDIFDREKESENDRPDVFTDDQLFIIFEFADGGKDLESAKFHNIFEAKSVLTQVAFSLAIAEEALQFEHRDLHWGNVLMKKTNKTHIKYKLMDQIFKIDSCYVHVSIIDFTLSRLHTNGVTTYNNLATDDTLFEGVGDYQFDIYRKMKEENGNNWEKFNPKSNIWWLHYLTDKLLRSKRYTRNTKDDQAMFRQMRLLQKEIPNYSSACELVTCSDFFSS